MVIGITVLTQGCSTFNGASTSSAMGQIVIAQPAPINYKSEIAIARLSDVITRVKITDEQRAQLFYDRGVLFDSVGLLALARFDFSRALQLKPDLVDAYNFLGIHYTQMNEFSQAYEKFDSVLELAPDHEYARLNRGIALYYGERAELAVSDFIAFHKIQNDDPYRLLWLYLAEYKINAELAKQNLKTRSAFVDEHTWAKQVIYLYLGELSQQQFMTELTENVSSSKALTDRLCEAYFYLGKYNLIKGNQGVAANFFKLALSTNVYDFVEHRYAKLELNLMFTKKVDNSKLEQETEL